MAHTVTLLAFLGSTCWAAHARSDQELDIARATQRYDAVVAAAWEGLAGYEVPARLRPVSARESMPRDGIWALTGSSGGYVLYRISDNRVAAFMSRRKPLPPTPGAGPITKAEGLRRFTAVAQAMGFDVTLEAFRWEERLDNLERRPVFNPTLGVVWRGVPYSVEFGWPAQIDARTGQVERLSARYLVRPPADLVPKITPEAAERAAHAWARRTVQAARPILSHPTRLVISYRGEDTVRARPTGSGGIAWEDAYPGTLAYEAYVRDEAAAGPEAGEAYTVFIDAQTGEAFRALGSLLRRGNVIYEWDKDRPTGRGGS